MAVTLEEMARHEEFALHLATCQASNAAITGALVRRRGLHPHDANMMLVRLGEMFEFARGDGEAEACEIIFEALRGHRELTKAQLSVVLMVAKRLPGYMDRLPEEIKEAIQELERTRRGLRVA